MALRAGRRRASCGRSARSPTTARSPAQNHAELVATIYKSLMGPDERIPEDWFAKQVAFADRTDGDIDTLANRIAHIRTWTFVSNRADWLQGSGALAGDARARSRTACRTRCTSSLTQRFVDRAHQRPDEGHARQGRAERRDRRRRRHPRREPLSSAGSRASASRPTRGAEGIHGKAARNAAAQVLSRELAMRARRVAAAKPDAFKLTPPRPHRCGATRRSASSRRATIR